MSDNEMEVNDCSVHASGFGSESDKPPAPSGCDSDKNSSSVHDINCNQSTAHDNGNRSGNGTPSQEQPDDPGPGFIHDQTQRTDSNEKATSQAAQASEAGRLSDRRRQREVNEVESLQQSEDMNVTYDSPFCASELPMEEEYYETENYNTNTTDEYAYPTPCAVQSWPNTSICRRCMELERSIVPSPWITAPPQGQATLQEQESLSYIYWSETMDTHLCTCEFCGSQFEFPDPEVPEGAENGSTDSDGQTDQQSFRFPAWNISHSPSLQFVGSFAEATGSEEEFHDQFTNRNNTARTSYSYPHIGSHEIPDFTSRLAFYFPSTTAPAFTQTDDAGYDEFTRVQEWYNRHQQYQTTTFDPSANGYDTPQLDENGNIEGFDGESRVSLEALAGSIPETPFPNIETPSHRTSLGETVEETHRGRDDFRSTARRSWSARRFRPRRYLMRLPEFMHHYGDQLRFYRSGLEEYPNPSEHQWWRSYEDMQQDGHGPTFTEEVTEEIVEDRICSLDSLEVSQDQLTGQLRTNPEEEGFQGQELSDALTRMEILVASEFPLHPGHHAEIRYESDADEIGNPQSLATIRNQLYLNVPIVAPLSPDNQPETVDQAAIERSLSLPQFSLPINEALFGIGSIGSNSSGNESVRERIRQAQEIIRPLAAELRQLASELGQISHDWRRFIHSQPGGEGREGIQGVQRAVQVQQQQAAWAPEQRNANQGSQDSLMEFHDPLSSSDHDEENEDDDEGNDNGSNSSSNSDLSTAGGDADVSDSSSDTPSDEMLGEIRGSVSSTEDEDSVPSASESLAQVKGTATEDTQDTQDTIDTFINSNRAKWWVLKPRPFQGHRYTISTFGIKERDKAQMSQPGWVPSFAYRLNIILTQYLERRDTTSALSNSDPGASPSEVFARHAAMREPSPRRPSPVPGPSSSPGPTGPIHNSKPSRAKSKSKYMHPFHAFRKRYFSRKRDRDADPNRSKNSFQKCKPRSKLPQRRSNSSTSIAPPSMSEARLRQQTSCPNLGADRNNNRNPESQRSTPAPPTLDHGVTVHRIRSEMIHAGGSHAGRLSLPPRVMSVDSLELVRRRVSATAAGNKKKPCYTKILRYFNCKKKSKSRPPKP